MRLRPKVEIAGAKRTAYVVLHTCCGPCACACVPRLREEGREPVMLFANSNIDTREEFERRKASAMKLAENDGVEFAALEYDHGEWLREVAAGYENEPERGRRCERCFRYNLRKAAEFAVAHGIEAFTTSLTVSPHKASASVFKAGEEAGEGFLAVDFKKREGFKVSTRRAAELGLYRQAYCGCEFSRRKTALVTGGTVRVGKAIAEWLRAAGWRVVTSSHRPDSGADVVADLSEPGGAAKLYAATLKLLGGNPPDALVNNAGLFVGEDGVIEAVNLESPKKLTMMMAGREEGRGAVVNVLDCREREGAYGESKRALGEYTEKSAAMFADTLRVNAVALGPVMAPTEVHERAGETPLGRPTPEDVAEAVGFLLRAKATTGTVVFVDGGEHLA